MNPPPPRPTGADDLERQRHHLAGVARTFALTIRTLPNDLVDVVGNLYLLCRIADTIEDDPALTPDTKDALAQRFVSVVAGRDDPGTFSRTAEEFLSPATAGADRELVADAATVLRITRRFGATQREAIERCVRIMTEGMAAFQRTASRDGLRDRDEFARYCYHVAGVVGETLTTFLCERSPEIAKRRDELLPLSVAFGQGLQMVNILKDIREDHTRGVCWLPRDVFLARGFELRSLPAGSGEPGFAAGIRDLIVVARDQLAAAFRFTLLLPAREAAVRRFCLWPLALGVLTLRRIRGSRPFARGRDLKLSRRAVRAVVVTTGVLAPSNLALKLLFHLAARSRVFR